ncbi:MAG: DUF711 family protein [Anaerolineales bacterium]|nr:DUF711 family protein [Anaerolineales bacterium]
MKIRSITYFCNPKFPLDEKVLREAGNFLARAKSAYEADGCEVQTVRVATTSFAQILGEKQIDQTPKYAEQLINALKEIGVNYAALGPALPQIPRSYEIIPEAISVSKDVFFGGVMADSQTMYMKQIKACAEVIVKSAPLEANGFANLQFAALANVGAGAPFFPAAYHDASQPAFAVATEAADLAVNAFEGQKTMEEGRRTLVADIEKHGQALARIAKDELAQIRFLGADFSLAPFPDDAHSLGNAVEQMGAAKIGLHGSLAAAALLAEAIERANFPRVGFSGFMQPILEDSILAKRAAEGTLTVKDALLYSAVCGTGLDTIPLAGDVRADELAPLLLDVCALALRLNKPLTARLMPVPGKKVGDATNFDFAFFANSKVMALDSEPLKNSLADDAPVSLRARGGADIF